MIYARAEIIEDLDTAIDTLVKINTRGTTVDAAQRQALTAAVSKTAAKRAVIKFHPERYVVLGSFEAWRTLLRILSFDSRRLWVRVGSGTLEPSLVARPATSLSPDGPHQHVPTSASIESPAPDSKCH